MMKWVHMWNSLMGTQYFRSSPQQKATHTKDMIPVSKPRFSINCSSSVLVVYAGQLYFPVHTLSTLCYNE